MTFILQASDKTITHRRACQQHVASLSTRSKTALPWKKKSVGKHSLLCHKSRSLNSISYVSFSSVASALISSLNCAVGKKKIGQLQTFQQSAAALSLMMACTSMNIDWPGARRGSGASISPFMISDEPPCDPHFINMLSRKGGSWHRTHRQQPFNVSNWQSFDFGLMSKVGAIAARHHWSSRPAPFCHNRKGFSTTKRHCLSKLSKHKILEPV